MFVRSHNVYFISFAHICMLIIYKFKIFKQDLKCPKTGTPPFSRGKRRRFLLDIGILGYWDIGILGYWDIGILGYWE